MMVYDLEMSPERASENMALTGHILYSKKTLHFYRIFEYCLLSREIAVKVTLTVTYIRR
jgi:hypothetical protein